MNGNVTAKYSISAYFWDSNVALWRTKGSFSSNHLMSKKSPFNYFKPLSDFFSPPWGLPSCQHAMLIGETLFYMGRACRDCSWWQWSSMTDILLANSVSLPVCLCPLEDNWCHINFDSKANATFSWHQLKQRWHLTCFSAQMGLNEQIYCKWILLLRLCSWIW